jgi:competence protein ComEC
MAIVFLGVAWLVGIWLASVIKLHLVAWLLAVVGGLGAAIIFRSRGRLGLAPVLAAALFLGGARARLAAPSFGPTHVAYYNGNRDVTVAGLVVDEPGVHDTYVNLRLKAVTLTLPGSSPKSVSGMVLVTVARFPVIEYGTLVEVTGFLNKPPVWEAFNYREYLAKQGVYSIMNSPELVVVAEGQGSQLRHGLVEFRRGAHETVKQLFPEPQASLLAGILLGDDSGMDGDLVEAFRITGLSHVIAISGFNIAILVGILLAVARPLFGGRRSAWFALCGVAFYTILVGAGASVVRAAIMGSLYVVALYLLGRATFAPAGLFTASIAMTLADPHILWDVGFQLSFMATLGLMLYVEPWSRWSEQRLQPRIGSDLARRVTRLLAEVLFATVAATLLTLPVMALHFGQLSLIGLMANLFVLPAQAGVMTWGGLATLAGRVVPAVGQVFAWVAWLFLSWTVWLVRLFAAAPGAAVPILIPPGGVLAIYAVIFGLTWYAKLPEARRASLLESMWRWVPPQAALVAAGIAAALGVAWATSQPDGKLHVQFFDVGQGDATFIQTPSGRQILVDGGLYPNTLNEALGRQMPFWDREIDIVVATHPDADHVSGLPGVFERYRVGRLITDGEGPGESAAYDAVLLAAQATATEIHGATSGETIAIGDGVRLEILHPGSGSSGAGGNDNSVCLRLVYGDFTLLMTGDAETEGERMLLESGQPLSALVFKAGHHGSNSSSTMPFLEAVGSQIMVISVGEDNRYGHPHPEVLARAEAVGAAVLRTDELGTIEIISDGERMWWQADRPQGRD